MEVVRIMLLVVLSLSYFYNCYLGMEYTYMFPQTACVTFTAALLTCFTGKTPWLPSHGRGGGLGW